MSAGIDQIKFLIMNENNFFLIPWRKLHNYY